MSLRSSLVGLEHRGARSAATYLSDPNVIRESGLGAFNKDGSPEARLLCRVLLAARIPLSWLTAIRDVVPAKGRPKFERFVARYAYWHGVRRSIRDHDTWRSLTQTPVILMYHAVARRNDAPSCYVVPRRRFRWQMAWLYWRGYKAITVADLARQLSACRPLPPRTVVVTFDDAYEDVFHEAVPILRRYRFPATVFVVSGSVGDTAAWPSDRHLAGRRTASRRQLQEMAATGVEIGAHTVSHPSLTSLSQPARETEIRRSRHDLEQMIGRPITSFAYPFGNYDEATSAAVEGAGFHAACCSRSGRNDSATPLFELRRVEVRGTDSFPAFIRMVWAGTRGRRRFTDAIRTDERVPT